MSVDPSTLTETITTPPINSWETKWNNTIITTITSSTQLEAQCINSKCTINTNECECIKRIIFIMHFYSTWINANSNSIDNNTKSKNDSSTNYLLISLSEFILNLKHYSIIQLTNDWLHLRQYHWTDINIQYDTRKLFQSIIGDCNELEQCSIFARVNRDRDKFKNNEIRKRLYFINTHKSSQNETYDESCEVTAQQLCDSIHDCIFHAPIIFLPKTTLNTTLNSKLNEALNTVSIEESKQSNNNIIQFPLTNEQKYDNLLCNPIIHSFTITPVQSENAYDQELDDDEWDMDVSTEASMLRLLSSTSSGSNGFTARKAAVSKLKNTNSKYFQHSKFVTSVADMPDIDIEPSDEKISTNNLNIFDAFNAAVTDNEDEVKDDEKLISKQPVLTKVMSSGYNMVSYEFGIEMMYSQHFQKHAKWSTMKDEVLKNENKKYCISMSQWKDTIKKVQQWMQCIRGKILKATDSDESMNINIGDPVNVSSLMSCLLYTNFTDLQRRFSGSTRRYKWQQMETDNDIKIKHYRNYYHWGKTLMICICCYGESMNEKLSFYHGINTELVFGEFTAYFNCPTSTTISLAIASSFASKDGIILKLSGRVAVKTKTTFMDVSWFSDYPNEEERLFYGHHNVLEIRSIYRGNRDYKNFVRAIKVLDMLTDPTTFFVGQAGRRYVKINESKYYNHLLSMIKNSIDKKKYEQEIEQQKADKTLRKKEWKTKQIPSDYMQSIFNHFCRLQATIAINWKKLAPLLTDKLQKHELAKYFLIKEHSAQEQFVYCFNIPVLIRLFPKVKFITLDFGGNKQLKMDQFEYACKHVAKFLNVIKKDAKHKKYDIQTVTLAGLSNATQYKHLTREDAREIRKKYLSNTRCKVSWDKKSVQFTLFAGKKQIRYENVFVGNLHEKTKSEQNKKRAKGNKKKIQWRKKMKKKTDVHVWTMFISSSKEKLVLPKTIKKVIYTLDKKTFKNSVETVSKSPFLLKKKGNKTFKVKVKVIFRGKRNDLQFEHMLNFDHAVTITHVMFDYSIRKHSRNDVYHSDNYHAFAYYSMQNGLQKQKTKVTKHMGC